MKKEVEIFNKLYETFVKDCSDQLMKSKNIMSDKSEYNQWYKERMFLLADEYKDFFINSKPQQESKTK
jgi:hypothetical protein